MRIKPMKQSTVESCLTCCILMKVNQIKEKRFTKKDEVAGIMYALKHASRDFITGHKEWARKKIKVKMKVISEHDVHVGDILNVDCFYLGTPWHYPHFLIIMKETGKTYQIYNPWTGNIHGISKNKLKKARQSLEKYLGFTAIRIIIS